jgi:hypothetical protein
VRLLAALQAVEGDCTARLQRGAKDLMISFIVLDPTKLLAAELSTADRLATTGIASPFSQGHAFISYVREDADKVEELQRFLQASGIPVWLDTAEISPGADWRNAIRRAISDGALVFLACFSRNSVSRGKSFQHEELVLAVEHMRSRRPDEPWLIPVRFDDCQIPDLDLGGGRTLASIDQVDLFGASREPAGRRLVEEVERLLR